MCCYCAEKNVFIFPKSNRYLKEKVVWMKMNGVLVIFLVLLDILEIMTEVIQDVFFNESTHWILLWHVYIFYILKIFFTEWNFKFKGEVIKFGQQNECESLSVCVCECKRTIAFGVIWAGGCWSLSITHSIMVCHGWLVSISDICNRSTHSSAAAHTESFPCTHTPFVLTVVCSSPIQILLIYSKNSGL